MVTQDNLTDMHTACLNRLAGSFQPDACRGLSLRERGYRGFLDPTFGSLQTDFLSIGESDVQHFRVIGAKSKIEDLPELITDPDTISEQLEGLLEIKNLDDDDISSFFSKKGINFDIDHQEIVALVPKEAHDRHKDLFSNFSSSNDIIVWQVDLHNENRVKKVHGHHEVPELEEKVSESGGKKGIELHDINSSICPAVRGSDLKLVKLKFSKRLVTYSYHEQTTKIHYDDLDGIMLGDRQALLSHLPSDKRDEYWQQCMLTLRNTCDQIRESKEGVNLYEWKKERFLYDNSARSNLVEDIRSDLGIGEEA